MEHVELLVSVLGKNEPIVVTVPHDGRVIEVIEIIRKHGDAGLVDVEEIFLFLEDGEEPLGVDMGLEQCGIGHRHHIHAHRCRAIEVTIAFDGIEKFKPFAPSIHVGEVKKWAMEAFKAPPENADYFLADGDKRLDDMCKILSLAHHCHLRLHLVAVELTIRYTVNSEPQIAHERHRTPRVILDKAEIDPATHYLKHGNVSYKDNSDQPILLHESEEFTAIYSGSCTVS